MTKNVGDVAQDAEKKRLIADGALYRVRLACAKIGVAQNLRPEALWHGALSHALVFAAARVEHMLAPGGVRMQTVMPYVLAGLSLITRRKMIKPALSIGVVAATAVAWLVRRRRK